MKATPIPAHSREAVSMRDQLMCARCGGRGTDWHHRRSRSIRDELTHSPANGVLLCRSCHDWAHAHPSQAREFGFIVSRYASPLGVPFKRFDKAWVFPDIEGGYQTVEAVSIDEAIERF